MLIKNILITAAGCPGFYSTKKSIEDISFLPSDLKIHGCDMNANSIGLKLCDSSFVSPKADCPTYTHKIFQYCNENDIDLIIPFSDEELFKLAKCKNLFSKIGCKILVSEPAVIKTILNKDILFEQVKNIFPRYVPDYVICNDIEAFKKGYDNLRQKNDMICVKPAVSHGSRGFRVISDITKNQFFNDKSSSNYISYDSLVNLLSSEGSSFPDLMIMEYMSGEEYSVDCMRNGEFVAVPRTRDDIQGGICVAGETVENFELMLISEAIYDLLKIKYHANFQYRYDKHGTPKLLEINPRFSGTMEHCRGSGVNFVENSIRSCAGVPNKSNHIRWGTSMRRVWKEIFCYENKTFEL